MRRGIAVGLVVLGCVVALSGSVALAADQTFVVNSQNDANDSTCNAAHCSLREAINAANAAAGHDTIVFNIPGAGVHTIIASSAPPIIDNAVTIDARTESDYAGTPLIEFRGTGVPGANGLWFNLGTATSTVRGMALTSWEGAGVLTQASTTVVLEDNYLGMSPDGVTARPNLTGVTFLGGSGHVVDGNLISGNTQAGLRIQDVTGATVQGNRIGTNAAGTAARPNAVGIEIFPTTPTGTSGVSIGGTGTEGNQVAGNSSHGILIQSSTNSSVNGTTIGANLIGTNAGGANLGNGGHGVMIRGFNVNGPTTNTTIGTSGASDGNIIAFNGLDGVSIETNAPGPENVRNPIRGNTIDANGGLGIDLGPNGVTANDALDADEGANRLQNFPILTDATPTSVTGTLDSAPNLTYAINIYSNPSTTCDASGNGEGASLVASYGVTTDGAGHADISAPLGFFATNFVTATASDLLGNTSEFSPCQTVASGPQPGPTFTVNTSADGEAVDFGCSTLDCTLREAIIAANGDGVASTVEFEIPGAAPHLILLDTPLPAITADLTLDATTESDWADSPVVGISGDLGIADGLELTNVTTTVRGLAIGGFTSTGISANGGQLGLSASYIGTNVGGTAAHPNGIGVLVRGSGHVIGSAGPGEGNVISGNTNQGVLVADGTDNLIQGNRIGTDAEGTTEVPNTTGIEIVSDEGSSASSGNRIGGDQPGEGNLVSGNVSAGILLRSTIGAPGVTGTEIEGNLVGTATNGVADLGNGGDGVQLGSVGNLSGNAIGGTGTGQGNTIAHNAGAGVSILNEDTNSGNPIRGNSVHSNGGLGIDLAADGHTPNDAAPDADVGANDLQNFPVLTFASPTNIAGDLDSEANELYQVDLYSSDACDPSGFGEGATHVTSFVVGTGPSGHTTFTSPVVPPLNDDDVVVALTATDSEGNTSEFSSCVNVAVPIHIVNDNGDGEGSTPECDAAECQLNEAIETANDVPGPARIEFDLAGDTQIALQNPLPAITSPVVIDGNSQPVGTVTINGDGAGAADGLGLATGSGGSTIEGLEIRDFSGAAIRIQSNSNTVLRNLLRTSSAGVVIEAGAAVNLIGGTVMDEPSQGNRIWDIDGTGVLVENAGTGNEIAGNTIGLDPLDNPSGAAVGIEVSDTPSTIVGDDAFPGDLFIMDFNRGNVVVASTGDHGIGISGTSTGTRVTGNFVGTDRDGSTGLGNGRGIHVDGSSGNQLGPGNTIARNTSVGIRLSGGSGNRIVANFIHDNGGLGINLVEANGGIDAPALDSATTIAGAVTVEGTMTGTPGQSFFIEYFTNDSCDPSGSGEGKTFISFSEVTLTGTSAPFSANLGALPPGTVVTATATDAFTESTSEFSNCATVDATAAPAPAPVLFGAVADATPNPQKPADPPSLGVAGLVDSGQPQAGQVFDVQFYSASSCDPIAPRTSLGVGEDFLTNQTGVAGFAKDGLANVPVGTIVFATATRPGSLPSPISNCVVADFNNTSWHTARTLATPTDSQTGALRASGEGRWFKVPVLPNSRVNVDLSGLPADYDLVVFSDIQKAYEELVGTNVDPQVGPNLARKDLERQGAETQDDVFNTSQYDSSSWDPTNWDPNLNNAVFNASQWSASQWSASQWSASQWSASQWSASQWSASQWSASQWSASQWSASQWSPSQWSASQWSSSNPSDPRSFTGAQTTSLLAVSAKPGTGDESVSVNTWNNTGEFYFRVQGKNGSFDPVNEFSISVSRQGSQCADVEDEVSTPVAPSGLGTPKTLILTDSDRLDLSTLTGRLDTLKARADVAGVVVDVDDDPTVHSLNEQADLPQFRSCPFAKNLVASAIKRIVAAYRNAYPSIQYAVVVGDDTVIPFFRYPDPALMANETMYVPPVADDTTSQASLRLGYILSDDFIASSTSIKRGGKELPVTDLSVGRLVETPQEIAGMLDAYLGTTAGVVPTPTTSLTTGYDHLTDAADKIAGQLSAGIGGAGNRTLITNQAISPGVTNPPGATPVRTRSWTADNLRSALLGPARNDLVFLAGHFSANDALAADYKTNILTTELTAAPTNFVNTIVFSAGCHAGYNIINGHATIGTEPLDWAQAFARKRATLISGTGYQYGDTDFIAHGERIYAEFARQLRVTTQRSPGGAPVREAVAVGRALLRAKQAFLKETPGLTSLDEKSLLQTTLFGLPMLSVNMPQGRILEPPKQSIVTTTDPVGSGPGQALGLRFKEVQLGATLTAKSKQLKEGGATPNPPSPLNGPLATWLEGPNGVAVRPTQPILPLQSVDVTSPDPNSALRGVGFRSGTYVDTGGTTPLTAAPATELRGIHAPFFTDVFFPTQPWSVNYFDALAGGQTLLHVTPVQHRSESPEMTRRVFSNLGLQLFYSGNVTSFCPGTFPLVATPPPCLPAPFGQVTAVTPALAAPPTISGVETTFDDTTDELTFSARVVGDPAAGIQAVWVTWTIPPVLAGQVGVFASVDLVRDADDESLWKGVLHLDPGVDPGDVHFAVQALNGVGLVAIDHNVGAFYVPGSIPGNATTPPGQPPAATQLTFTTPAPPPSVEYGKSFQVTVELTSAGAPLENRLVSIGIGANGIPVMTNENGLATIQLQASLAPGSYDVTASFSGDATHAFADASESILVVPRTTTLTLGGTLGGTDVVAAQSVHAILQATDPSTPLHQRSVFVIFTGTGPTNTTVTRVFAGETDPQGRIDVTSAFLSTLPVGNYDVDAYFNGVDVDGLFLPPDSPQYLPAEAHAALGVGLPFYLHGTGAQANPSVLTLDGDAPVGSTAKFRDSSSVNFAGGNPWKDIGSWNTVVPGRAATISSLGDLHAWLGLKNSDDQGTQFDLRAEISKNGAMVKTGIAHCIKGVTRNESQAKEVTVGFAAILPALVLGANDVLTLKLSTRIGTTGPADPTKCAGPGGSHANATGLRVYFDSAARPARFHGRVT